MNHSILNIYFHNHLVTLTIAMINHFYYLINFDIILVNYFIENSIFHFIIEKWPIQLHLNKIHNFLELIFITNRLYNYHTFYITFYYFHYLDSCLRIRNA